MLDSFRATSHCKSRSARWGPCVGSSSNLRRSAVERLERDDGFFSLEAGPALRLRGGVARCSSLQTMLTRSESKRLRPRTAGPTSTRSTYPAIQSRPRAQRAWSGSVPGGASHGERLSELAHVRVTASGGLPRNPLFARRRLARPAAPSRRGTRVRDGARQVPVPRQLLQRPFVRGEPPPEVVHRPAASPPPRCRTPGLALGDEADDVLLESCGRAPGVSGASGCGGSCR